MSDPDSLSDEYLELLKGALAHTLYAHVDGGINYRRNVLGRALFAALRARDIVPVRIGPRAARERMQGNDWPVFAQTMVGRARLDSLQRCVEDVIDADVPGDLIEAGVWRGGASIFMRGVLKARGVTDRVVWACDSFEGLPAPDPRYPPDTGAIWHWWKPLSVSLEEVTAHFARYGLLDDNVRFVKGWFEDTLPGLHDRRWALIRLDGDMYRSTTDALTHLYPNLSPGGYLVIDDYGGVDACRQAVHDYRDEHGVTEPIKRIDWTGAYWQRAAPAS
ncbi:MAG: TylF/MycF/NovP-related O-methyltransferase [Solirubrobacteraceae bacterium]